MFPDLSPGKHLLMDNVSVADTYRLRRTVHQPRRDPAEPVLLPEKPWEATAVTTGKVMYDPGSALWRMWYVVYDPKLEAERKKLNLSKHGNIGEPQPFYLCYATSRDGVRWDRPALGLYADTNICFKGYSGINSQTILLRRDAPPEQRYLLVNCEWRSMEIGGIYIAYSADGIHWAYPPGERPLIHGESDCNNGMLYNIERKVYMLYMRGWHSAAIGWISDWVGGAGYPTGPVKNARRRVTYSESADLVHWSEPQVIYAPDELDTNDFYGFSPFRYANAYFSQLWVHDDDAAETIHTELAWSRDGVRWGRHPERPKFLATGEKGELDGYMVIPAQEPVAVGDTLYLYVNAYSGYPHDCTPADGSWRSAAYRTRLRMDGFVSLNADRRLGCLITRPFVLQGDRITINAATQGGRIVAELAEPYWYDPVGKPIEGFRASDFDAFEGDSMSHALSWRGRSELSALKGRRLMLRMALYHAQLYSFTI